MSIKVLSADDFRKKLAGLTDLKESILSDDLNAMKQECINFVLILPKLFSDELDRKTLWERIGNGLDASIAKSGGDFQQFVNLSLEYIKASSGRVASSQELLYFIESMELRPVEWLDEFLSTMKKKKFVIIVKARSAWEIQKKAKVVS